MKKRNFNKDFQIPDGYFENQHLASHLMPNGDFLVPPQYFKSQEEQIIKIVENKKITFFRRRIYWSYFSIAAALILLFIGIWKININSSISPSEELRIATVINDIYIENTPESSNLEFKKKEIPNIPLTENSVIKNDNENLQENLIAKNEIENKENSEENSSDKIMEETLYDLYIDELSSTIETDLNEEDVF